jgi:serine/threonine protein kinase
VTPEGNRQIESLCLEALARRAEERAAFLDEACAGDAELRREVEALLARADGFLETPAWEAASPLQAGARLGPYEIQAAVGHGGMGEVYKARDTRLDRTVAIKILPSEFTADPGRRARFEREARAVAGLNHPHVCALYDIGEGVLPNPDPRIPNAVAVHFLVMEYLAGETLAARLEKGPLPLGHALRSPRRWRPRTGRV